MKYIYSTIILLFLSFNLLYGQNACQKIETYNELRYVLNDAVDTLFAKKTSDYFQEYSDSLIYFVFNDISSLKTYNISSSDINTKELPDFLDISIRPTNWNLLKWAFEDKEYLFAILDQNQQKRDTFLFKGYHVKKKIENKQHSIKKEVRLFSKMEIPAQVLKGEYNRYGMWHVFLSKKNQIAIRRKYPSDFNLCNTKYTETKIEYINKTDSIHSFVVSIREIIDRWCEDKLGNTTVRTGIRIISGDTQRAKQYLQNEYDIDPQSSVYHQNWMFDNTELLFINADNYIKWGGIDPNFLRKL